MSTARGLLLAALCSFGLALAQSPFPSKPVRLIVTSPPGGSNAILNRIVGTKLGELVSHPVLIDNRPGAPGFVAAEMGAKSPPAGSTLPPAPEATPDANPPVFRKAP